MKDFINKTMIPSVMKFTNLKVVMAIKNGFMYTVPLTIIGSLFLLLGNIPISAVANVITNSGLASVFDHAFGATFGIAALIAVIGIAYSYAKSEGVEPLAPAILALCSYILTLQFSATDSTGAVLKNVLNKADLAAKGMIMAMFIAVGVSWLYCLFIKKGIKIKMPESVPEGVSNSFAAIIPGLAVITSVAVIYGILNAFDTTLIEVVYRIIQMPLQGLSDTLPGTLVIAAIAPFLWCFGVHGGAVSSAVTSGILQSNMLENQMILESGLELTIANGGHIITSQFTDQITSLTGNGITIGIVIYMLFMAKSSQYKQLGKLSIIPACFGINEPVIFSVPVVLNPIMFIPFVLTPVLSAGIAWISMYLGLVPLFSGITVPWTTPPVISGFICGGWRMALLHVVILLLSCALYFPFVRKMDQITYQKEQG